MKQYFLVLAAMLSAACSDSSNESATPSASKSSAGGAIVKANCRVCHAQGINGAPIIGNKKMWSERKGKGLDALTQNAVNGVGLMPPKGGKTQLTDEEIKQAVSYMLQQLDS